MWSQLDTGHFILMYIIGALIAAGITGGIRDEMDGLLDMFVIFFWPLALCGWVIYRVVAVFIQIGVMIKRLTT